jgi:hypothetical protein
MRLAIGHPFAGFLRANGQAMIDADNAAVGVEHGFVRPLNNQR